jgi:2-polyprenyl-3-methyl-5-hydroxy-6-metoxy-1,4-benzoquinol methylase
MLRKTAKRFLSWEPVASRLIDPVLKMHGALYRLAGYISQSLEQDGLHPKHRLMDYHKWFCGKMNPSWKVLDVGCGNGALAAELSGYCRELVAIDIDPGNIAAARRDNSRGNISYIKGDVNSYPLEGPFDAVVLSNVLEHIEKRVALLKRLSGMGGIFFIRVPMVDRDWMTLYKKERGLTYMLDPTHFIEYTFDSLKREISSAGLKMTEHRIRYGEIYVVCRKEE